MGALGAPPDVLLADVKWRVDSKPYEGRARFLPYIDAYLAARLLDEWVGPENWSDTYEPAHGKGLWCHLSIRVGETWVTKIDLGVPSNMEAEKGLVSDAFKRACSLKWGVGGNVYRLPNVWAPVTTKTDKNNNPVAVPNKDTLPAIIAELKRLGFSDAAAADATNDEHDEEPEAKPDAQNLESAPANPSQGKAALATFDDHKVIRHELSLLGPESKKQIEAWWKQQALPSIKDKDVLTAGQAESILSYLDGLHEARQKSPAQQIAARHAAPKDDPQTRAAGDAA